METAPTTTGSHEARARNAKAQALAAVLHAHGASVANVAELPPAGWSMIAELATAQTGRKVYAPNSQATIDAVARILGDLIAHENDQAAIAEQVAPIPAEGETVNDRKATDSGEYRRTVRALDRETAQAFAAFNGMAR